MHESRQTSNMVSTAHRRGADLYDRDYPRYPVREAARLLRIARGTLRGWVSGGNPLIVRPGGRYLSFNNLVEGCLLVTALANGAKISKIRQAVEYKRQQGERLLLRPDLLADSEIFAEEADGSLENYSRRGQKAMSPLLDLAALKDRLLDVADLDNEGHPTRLYPPVPDGVSHKKVIAIDPLLRYGRPFLTGSIISTNVIKSRADVGEAYEDIASDYGVAPRQIRDAILYEQTL